METEGDGEPHRACGRNRMSPTVGNDARHGGLGGYPLLFAGGFVVHATDQPPHHQIFNQHLISTYNFQMMNHAKIWMSLLGIATASLLLFGSIGGASTEPLMAPEFYFSPPETPGTGSAGLTMALVSPSYKNLEDVGEPFSTFQESLEAEIMEVLTTKGYSVRGPFDNRDEMLYSDKENSHLALIIEVEPDIQKATGSWSTVKMADNSTGYRFSKGTLNIFGKINLTALEPISGEKMWAKSVNIPKQVTEEFTSSKVFVGSRNTSDLTAIVTLAANGDANVANPITKALEKSFGEIMTKIWNHLDPAEFKRMEKKIAELKAKG